MANKKPPTYPTRYQQATDVFHSAVDTVSSIASSVEEYVSTPGETDPTKVGFLQGEIESLKGVGKWVFFDLIPGIRKIGRGLAGLVAGPVLSIAGALTGIPPTEVNNLVSGLNTSDGFLGGIWSKFKELSAKQPSLLDMTWGQRFIEGGKRLFSLVANPIVGTLSSIFNTGIANVVGGAATIAGGLGRLQKKLKKDSSIYQFLEKSTPFGKVADLAGSATETLDSVMNSANFWGKAMGWFAKTGIAQKILSPERIKLWQAYGNDFLVAAANGDKEKILQMVKGGVMDSVSGFAKRLGASEKHLEYIQSAARGDWGPLNEVVKSFIPGFDIKDAKGLMGFATTVKQTFTSALTQFSSKYVPGADFEKVTMGMTDLLGLKDAALQGVAAKLGDVGKRALGQQFETIRTKGDKMVAAAADFVKNIQDPGLREKMGYTLAAGNMQEALAALVQQKATPDFISKIHTFKLTDSTGKEAILDPTALETFKKKANAAIAKVAQKATASLPEPPAIPTITTKKGKPGTKTS